MDLGEKNQLRLTQASASLSLGSSKGQEKITSISVITDETLHIPLLCEIEIMAKVPAAQTWLVESKLQGKCSAVVVAMAVVRPESERISLRILNPRNEAVSLKKREEITHMEPLLEEVAIAATTARKPADIRGRMKNPVKIGH